MASTTEDMRKTPSFPWGDERPRQRRDRLRGCVASVAGNLTLVLVECGERAVAGAERLEKVLADLAEAETRRAGRNGMPVWLSSVRTVRKEFRDAGLVLEELAALDADTRKRAVAAMVAAGRAALDEE